MYRISMGPPPTDTSPSHDPLPQILLVEDEPELADLYSTWLTDHYAVETVATGEAAIQVLDDSLDLVLLDRRLPDISGDEVLDHIETEYPGLPVAVVSAVTPGFGIMDTGIEHYLVKPVERPELLDLVEKLLHRSTRSGSGQELSRLQNKKSTLEAVFSDNELHRRDEYQELLTRIQELQSQT